tara:strand:+ start:226 stop:447 length:222 start_codon:yes stop_codon:yes gene_type:complete
MGIFITIIIILATGCLFVYAYKYNLELQKNDIIKNMENYAKKEKIKQQESKVLGQKQVKGKRNKKENTRMYHI